jgi:hypothetical protein
MLSPLLMVGLTGGSSGLNPVRASLNSMGPREGDKVTVRNRRYIKWVEGLLETARRRERRPAADPLVRSRHQRDLTTRKARWEAGERPRCKQHPDRIVNRSAWLKRGLLKCGSCKNRYASSERRPAQKRYDHSEQRRRRTRSTRLYHKIQENKI